MAIITFWGNNREHVGKTLSVVAVATQMAIEHNKKILILSTSFNDDTLKNCFFEDDKKTKKNLGIFGANSNNIALQNGIEGLDRIVRSNRVTPDIITDYTKIVFKNRLEVLLGYNEEDRQVYTQISENYQKVIELADKYYDIVLVDLDTTISKEIQDEIIKISDILIVTLSQRLKALNNFIQIKERNPLFKDPKVLLLIGRYDKFSKYTSKNISRYLGEKNQVLTLPYNTQYFEACEEARVPDMFLKLRKIDSEDRNAFFISEVNRLSENILYRLQVLQQRR